ncbi:hypothetical protein WHR41_04617 [Cladosporium halotolerans]|uniref:Survival motor neuron Tudor domain-containing protein n=1 Tax=Cladosporium halotolerans TaxID=1052096 RepID=A0AB34KRB3_9PEZI
MQGGNLTHEEIWDDSDLQASWDDALAEYKKYHSLAAKGEQIDLDKLENEEESQALLKPAATQAHQQPLPNSTHSATGASAQATAAAEHVSESSMPATAVPSTATGPSVPPSTNGPLAGAAMPQALLSTMQDEGMKNLVMSWYYAGYYTGLLEGQQKAYASMQEGG